MPRAGTYKHLDADTPLKIEVDLKIEVPMATLAAQVAGLNYGFHRFLSETLILRRARFAEKGYPNDKRVADAIEKMLEDDLY